MTYSEAIDFLFGALPVFEQTGAGAYKPGLERVREFTTRLGNPQERFATIHVAGTNGKGSTCHMLAAVLQSAGQRTGLFTSPHLVDFRERIRTGGEMIPREAVVEFTEVHRDEMVEMGLSFFEMTAAMAFWWFARVGCSVAVIETGLGGRRDATNIITPRVSVITNIGIEHTQYLGDSIAAIAGEKAGIIKAGVPVVVGETDPESAPIFRARAAALGSEIVFADQTQDPAAAPFTLDLEGDHQRQNLATVLATIAVLRHSIPISDEAVRQGLAQASRTTGLRGRWEVLSHAPLVVCDTAHNAHGIARIARQIVRQRYLALYMVVGFAADKDLEAIIPLLPRDAHYIVTQADTPRAMPAEELQSRFESHGIASEAIPSVAAAIDRAFALASPRDMVYIGGSNFVVGEALRHLDC